MTVYTIRSGFNLIINKVFYGGGQQVDLDPGQFERHKHLLEEVDRSVELLNFPSSEKIAAYDDTIPNLGASNYQEAIAALDSITDKVRTTFLDNNLTLTVSKQPEQGQFSTLTSALSYVEKNIDLKGYQISIFVNDGDYTSEGIIHLPSMVAPSSITCVVEAAPLNAQLKIIGNNRSSVIFAGFELDHSQYFSLENLTLSNQSDVASSLIKVQRGGILAISNLDFLGNNNQEGAKTAILATDSAIIYLRDLFIFSAFFARVFAAVDLGVIKLLDSTTLTTISLVDGLSTENLFFIDNGTIDFSLSFFD